MDTARGFGDPLGPDEDAASNGDAAPLAIGTDERRMQVRAYNHWVALLHGRPFPAIADLDPSGIPDFGPYSVLLDFTQGMEDPGIAFLGTALSAECELDGSPDRVGQVPGRSLLSRLTDHYLQIIANRAPIGFEAEFTNARGNETAYRGILMPFSSNGATIDYVYGVINWKELVDPATQARLTAELAEAVRSAPAAAPVAAPVWADGPNAAGVPAEASLGTLAIETGAPTGALVLLVARVTAPGLLDVLVHDSGLPAVAAQLLRRSG